MEFFGFCGIEVSQRARIPPEADENQESESQNFVKSLSIFQYSLTRDWLWTCPWNAWKPSTEVASPSEKGKVGAETWQRDTKGPKEVQDVLRRVSVHVVSVCVIAVAGHRLRWSCRHHLRRHLLTLVARNYSSIHRHYGFQFIQEKYGNIVMFSFGSQALTSLSIYTAPRHPKATMHATVTE